MMSRRVDDGGASPHQTVRHLLRKHLSVESDGALRWRTTRGELTGSLFLVGEYAEGIVEIEVRIKRRYGGIHFLGRVDATLGDNQIHAIAFHIERQCSCHGPGGDGLFEPITVRIFLVD